MKMPFIFLSLSFVIFFSTIVFSFYSLLMWRFGRMRERIAKRLILISSPNIILTDRTFDLVQYSSIGLLNRLLRNVNWIRYLHDALIKLKWAMRCDQILLLMVFLAALFGFLVVNIGGSILLILLFSLMGFFCPLLYLNHQLSKRQSILEIQLPDILDFITRAMQAGNTFISSLKMAAYDAREPVASEFLRAFQEINFGQSVQNSMSNLSKRIDCPEMSYFAVAVVINQEIGGNLSVLIGGVSALIRERINNKLMLRALTSEARSSALILSVLPFVMVGLMSIVRPDFISVLWRDPVGRLMVGYTSILMLIGIIWMQKMSKTQK